MTSPQHEPTREPSEFSAEQLLVEGIRLQRGGKFEEAIAAYHRVIRLDPESSFAYANLGAALRSVGQPEAAVACYRRSLEISPENAVTHSNLGNALKDMGRFDESFAAHRRAIELDPDGAGGFYKLGVAQKLAGRLEEALESFTKAAAMDRSDANIQWERALSLLQLGDFRHGLPAYESRWKIRPRHVAGPRWDGSPLEGRTILLYEEQGFGDTIQFIRYVPIVKRMGGHILLECNTALHRLFRSVSGIDTMIARGTPLPPYDVQCPLISLPLVVGTELDSIPQEIPYLHPPLGAAEKFRAVLGRAEGRFKVGIVWSGSVTFDSNHLRATSLTRFLRFLDVPGVHLFSLQKGPPRQQLAQLGGDALVTDLGEMLDDFADTAAVIEQLDLVILTDTSVAHLAGALGRPVWDLLCHVADWRWLTARDDSPWYPTMRLFRQPAFRDWDSVFDRVMEELGGLVRSRVPLVGDTLLLDAAFRTGAGEPRFRMPIPRTLLHDTGIAFLCRHESQHSGYEYATRRFLDEHIEPGDLLIDVGAHWGVFSLQAATRHPGQVKVLAIEPHPQNVEQLRRWIEHNQVSEQVEIVAAAAGAVSGEVKLISQSTMGYRVDFGHTDDAGAPREPAPVAMTTLDALLAVRPELKRRRTFLKIDVEGHEPEVIEGSCGLLEGGRVAAIIWERGRNFARAPFRAKMLKMIETLERLGFSLFRFPHENTAGSLVPFVENDDLCNVFALAPGFQKKPVYEEP